MLFAVNSKKTFWTQRLNSSFAILMLAPLAFAQVSFAQEKLAEKELPKGSETKIVGWVKTASLGLNAAVSSSTNVVGQAEGSGETYGLNLKSGLGFGDEKSEWQNSLNYAGSTSKTPIQPRYVKSTDLLKLNSLYLFSLPAAPHFGPYAKASAEAPLFFGEDVRPGVTTYNIARRDGTVQSVAGSTLKLTDGFKPLTTKESVGGFWKAFDDGNVRIDTRVGAGAQQVAADGQLAVTSVAGDGSVSVSELKSLSQLGLEAAVTAKGKIDEKSLWEAGVETLIPFVSNKDASDDRSALRLTNVEGYAQLQTKITTWAAIVYDYKLVIKPQLVDKTQQSHMLVLNVNTNLL